MVRGQVCLLLGIGAAAALGCDVIAPPAPDPEPPPRGSYLSQPIEGIRSLNDVVVLAPDLAFAVGTDGTVLRYDGVAWAREESGVTADLEGVAGFVDGQQVANLLAVGAEGTVISRGASEAWSVVPSGVTVHLFGAWLRNNQDGFVVGEDGTILRWNGAQLVPQVNQVLQSVVGSPPVPCSGQANCLGVETCEAGVCTSLFPIAQSLKAVAETDGQMFVVGAAGAIYCYDPAGEPAGNTNRWQLDASGTTRNLAGLAVGNGTYAPTTDGVLLERVSGPCPAPRDANGRFTQENWSDELRTPTPAFLHDAWRGGGLHAVGLSADLYSFDGGSWTLVRVAEEAELRAIDGTFIPPPADAGPEDTGGPQFLAVGGGGRIVRGPLALPVAGETLLAERAADDEFVPQP